MPSYGDEEIETVRRMLLNHWGRDDQISSREINQVIEVDNVESFPTTRKIVRNRLMEDGLPVASGGDGYYLIKSQEELENEIESINGRVAKILQRRMKVAEAAADHHDDIDLTDVGLV